MLTNSMIIASIGLLLCLYAYTLEQKIKNNKGYKPVCDLSDRISCSKPILSEYGSVFGITNSLLGILFYISILILAALNMKTAIFFASLAACGASVIFTLILIFKIKSLCLVCFSIYVVNALLLWASWR